MALRSEWGRGVLDKAALRRPTHDLCRNFRFEELLLTTIEPHDPRTDDGVGRQPAEDVVDTAIVELLDLTGLPRLVAEP
jgi:hypothetical protein